MILFFSKLRWKHNGKKENSTIIVYFSSFTLHFSFYCGNNRRERLDINSTLKEVFSPSSSISFFESAIFSTRDTSPSWFTDSRQLPGVFRTLSTGKTTHSRTSKFRILFRTNRAYLSRSGSSTKKSQIQFRARGNSWFFRIFSDSTQSTNRNRIPPVKKTFQIFR